MTSRWHCIVLLVPGLLMTACATSLPIRGGGVPSASTVVQGTGPCEDLRKDSVERHKGFSLTFVEFAADGRLAEPAHLTNALAEIEKVDGRELVVILFVHGWRHTADPCDDHVEGFRKALTELTKANAMKNAQLVGIYVSWPAMGLREPLDRLTFWSRNRLVDRISKSCGAQRVFDELERAVDQKRMTMKVAAVSVGHSMGGKFLFTRVEQSLESAETKCPGVTKSAPIPPLEVNDLPLWGDFTLLVNPAQDVHDYEEFEKFNGRHQGSPPSMAIISSESDMVVGRMFRWGRTLRSLLPNHWHEFNAERFALGWTGDHITHKLCYADNAAPHDCPGNVRIGACTPGANPPVRVTDFNNIELRQEVKAPGPFVVVRSDGRIVCGHSDMFTDHFIGFFRSFISANLQAPDPPREEHSVDRSPLSSTKRRSASH